MRYHIVFELEATPDMSFMDVTAMTQIAATSFNRAVSPLGKCKLDAIKPIAEEPKGKGDGGQLQH